MGCLRSSKLRCLHPQISCCIFLLVGLELSAGFRIHAQLSIGQKQPRSSPYDSVFPKHEQLRPPAFTKAWSELSPEQQDAATVLQLNQHAWDSYADNRTFLDDMAGQYGDQEWSHFDKKEQEALLALDIRPWSWNELVSMRKAASPGASVPERVRKPYRDLRKCTSWDPEGKAALSERVFVRLFGAELETSSDCKDGGQVYTELRYENRRDATWAVYIYPQEDDNGAFCIDEWFCARALQVAEFFSVAIVRVRSPADASRWLGQQQAKGMKIGHLVLGGHGSPDTLHFAGNGYLRTGNDPETLALLHRARAMMSDRGSVFVDSCLTADEEQATKHGETLHSMVAREMSGHRVWGSKIAFSSSQIKVQLDKSGRWSAVIDEGHFRDNAKIRDRARMIQHPDNMRYWAYEYGYICKKRTPAPGLNTLEQCFHGCEQTPSCKAFTFIKGEREPCTFSDDCDLTRAPEQILFKLDGREVTAIILEERASLSADMRNSVEVSLRYVKGQWGEPVWVSMDKTSQHLLHRGNEKIAYKPYEDQVIEFQYPTQKPKVYRARILKERSRQQKVSEADIQLKDSAGRLTVFLNRERKLVYMNDAVNGNLDEKYKIDPNAPKYVKMFSAKGSTFLKRS